VTPESLEMLDHRRRGETGVGAAQHLGNAGVLPAASLDMRFVKHRVLPGVSAGGASSPQSNSSSTTQAEAVRRIIRCFRQEKRPTTSRA
jgi:hypothetical protein